MPRQTRAQINSLRRSRYKDRTRDAVKAKELRDLQVVSARFHGGLSYRQIAKKHGVSLGCVQKIIQRYQ